MSVKVQLPTGTNDAEVQTRDTDLYFLASIEWPDGQVSVFETNGTPPGPGNGPEDMRLVSGPASYTGSGEAEIQMYHSSSGNPGSYSPAYQGVYEWGSDPSPIVGANNVEEEPYEKGVVRMI